MTAPDNMATGMIRPDELYTLSAFKKQLGISDATVRSARRAGLRVRYRHRQGFIYGKDWIDYLLSSDEEHQNDSSQNASPVERTTGGRS